MQWIKVREQTAGFNNSLQRKAEWRNNPFNKKCDENTNRLWYNHENSTMDESDKKVRNHEQFGQKIIFRANIYVHVCPGVEPNFDLEFPSRWWAMTRRSFGSKFMPIVRKHQIFFEAKHSSTQVNLQQKYCTFIALILKTDRAKLCLILRTVNEKFAKSWGNFGNLPFLRLCLRAPKFVYLACVMSIRRYFAQ